MPDKAVIFDLFGTLCSNTDPEKEIIKRFNLSPNIYNALEQVVCGHLFSNWGDYTNGIIKTIGLESNIQNRNLIKSIIKQEKIKTKVFPETSEVLSLLSKKYKLGMISNAYPLSREILHDNKLERFFIPEALLLSYEIGLTKQSPELFKICLDKLRVNPENAVMVGNNLESDIKGAYNATNGKMKGILISSVPDKKTLEYVKRKGGIIISGLRNISNAIEDYF